MIKNFDTPQNFKISFADTFNTQSKYKCYSIIEKNENTTFHQNTELKNYYKNRYKILLNNFKNKKIHYKSNSIVWICTNCGYTHIGIDAPLVCPICNLPQNYFELQHDA